MSAKKTEEKQPQRKTKRETSAAARKENIRCRACFIIDGYVAGESICKHCGAKLYRIDVY
jgi:hypothetical protein